MPSSCSACLLPPADYPLWDSIGDNIVNRGLLSQLQLEGVMYASMKHLQWLPSGQRACAGCATPVSEMCCCWGRICHALQMRAAQSYACMALGALGACP